MNLAGDKVTLHKHDVAPQPLHFVQCMHKFEEQGIFAWQINERASCKHSQQLLGGSANWMLLKMGMSEWKRTAKRWNVDVTPRCPSSEPILPE